jgi:cytoskeletal protein CcmA (bactofilin family)
MWRKDEPGKPQSSPDPVPSRDSITERLPAVEALSESAPDTVSKGIRIKGEITGRGDLFWDGVLEGKIQIEDGNFTVGHNARINAEIEAREIIIYGEVRGALKGERVQVLSTGKVTGDVETHGIVIEDGAMLRSRVQVLREDEPLQGSRKPVPLRAKRAAATMSANGSSGPIPEKSGEA